MCFASTRAQPTRPNGKLLRSGLTQKLNIGLSKTHWVTQSFVYPAFGSPVFYLCLAHHPLPPLLQPAATTEKSLRPSWQMRRPRSTGSHAAFGGSAAATVTAAATSHRAWWPLVRRAYGRWRRSSSRRRTTSAREEARGRVGKCGDPYAAFGGSAQHGTPPRGRGHRRRRAREARA